MNNLDWEMLTKSFTTEELIDLLRPIDYRLDNSISDHQRIADRALDYYLYDSTSAENLTKRLKETHKPMIKLSKEQSNEIINTIVAFAETMDVDVEIKKEMDSGFDSTRHDRMVIRISYNAEAK